MTKLRVTPKFFDKTGDTLYSSKELRIDGKSGGSPITTPIMAMDAKEIRITDHLAEAAIGLSEIYRSVGNPDPVGESSDKTLTKPQMRIPLSKLVDDAKKQSIFNNEIQNQIDRLSGLVVFFMEYKGKRYPQEVERNFMLHTEHTFSDIPCLPIMPFISKSIIDGKQPFDEYLSFIRESIEYLRKYNEKPIMGIIVDFGFTKLERLIKLYVEKEINAFCIDLDCHTPVSHKSPISQCFRILKDYGKLENSFFYAINVNQGRFIKNKTVVNAKDILSYGFGLDAMGKRHRVKFPSKETIKTLGPRWKPLDRGQNKHRLFNKADYGYYKAENAKQIKNPPVDSSIPLETFTHGFSVADPHILHCEKIFNMEQLGLEAFKLRNIIKDEVPMKYLEPKEHLDRKDIKQILQFKDSVFNPELSQQTL